jgi:hypothetical protein
LKPIFLILFLLLVGFAKSQIAIGYSIGVLGENLNINSYSNPLAINSKSCIQISNGISKFLVSGKGVFFNTCAEKINAIKLNINVAPNPATEYTILKFGTKLQNEDRFNILIYNSAGQLVQKHFASQSQLIAGFRITTSSLAQGVFFINVYSSTINEVVKIIKD